MKRYLVALTLGLAAFLFAPGLTHAAAPEPWVLTSSGTSVAVVAVGEGTLFNIVIASGTAADYVVCYDTSSANGISATFNPGTNGAGSVHELARVFVTTTNTTTAFPPSNPPVHFTLGLACVQSAAQRTIVYFRQPS